MGDQHGGGVGFLVRKNLKVVDLARLTGSQKGKAEVAWIGLETRSRKIAFASVYVPPGLLADERKEIFTELQRQKNAVIVDGWEVCIMGDFNVNIFKPSSMEKHFQDWVLSENMILANTLMSCQGRFTRQQGQERSVTDYIIIGEELEPITPCMFIDEDGQFDMVSDHNLMWIDLNLKGYVSSTRAVHFKWNKTESTDWPEFQSECEKAFGTW